MSEHPNKNCDTISEIIPEVDSQKFQNLLTEMVLDDASNMSWHDPASALNVAYQQPWLISY